MTFVCGNYEYFFHRLMHLEGLGMRQLYFRISKEYWWRYFK